MDNSVEKNFKKQQKVHPTKIWLLTKKPNSSDDDKEIVSKTSTIYLQIFNC